WWDMWSPKTNPTTAPAIVLAGRTEQAERLRALLDQSPRITTIRGPSLEEVLAFTVASAIDAAAIGRGQTLARMVLVDEPAAWRSLLHRRGPLVLVPRTDALQSELP